MSTENKNADRRRGRRFKAIIATGVVVCVAVLLTPYLISKTSLRNAVLQSLIGDSNFSVSCEGASLGWFSPLRIDDVRLDRSDGSVKVAVKQLRAQKSWLALWLSSPDFGNLEVSGPQIEIVVSDQEEPFADVASSFDQWPTFAAVMKDGSLLVHEPNTEPVIDIGKIDIGFRIEREPAGAVLVVEAIKVVEHDVLTPEQCDQGLQLVMPGLSDEVSLEGEYSLELTKIRLSLDSKEPDTSSDPTQIEGVVTLHQVTTGLKNEVTQRLAMVAADLMKLGDVPSRIRLADNSELTFRLEQGRVHHEGIAFVFPEVSSDFSIRTTGSVGLDESIDLQALIQIPVSAVDDSPLAHQLSETPIVVRVTGTIDQPKVGLPAKQEWVSRLDDRLLSPDLSTKEKELADTIINLLRDLVDETVGPLPELPAPVMERVNSGTPGSS